MSPSEESVLRAMHAAELSEAWGDAELVCSGIECYVGLRRVSHTTVRALLSWCAVSETGEADKGTNRYMLNGTGRAALTDPGVPDRIKAALLNRQNVDDRGFPIDSPAPPRRGRGNDRS